MCLFTSRIKTSIIPQPLVRTPISCGWNDNLEMLAVSAADCNPSKYHALIIFTIENLEVAQYSP